MNSDQPSLTRNQELVLNSLIGAEGPLSAYSILDDLQTSGLRAPLQVYRALDKLMEIGLVHRLDSMNAFVACSVPHCGRSGVTAFTICGECGAAREFFDTSLLTYFKKIAEEDDFKLETSILELRGICQNCREERNDSQNPAG